MEEGLELTLVWLDDPLCEFECRAASRGFGGAARFYGLEDVPLKIAEKLDGFPRAGGDHAQLEFGKFRAGHEVGGFRLALEMFRAAGPLTARVSLRDGHGERDASVQLQFDVEPLAIDDFVRQLRGMKLEKGSCARLRAV
jgi:hypothetical protein